MSCVVAAVACPDKCYLPSWANQQQLTSEVGNLLFIMPERPNHHGHSPPIIPAPAPHLGPTTAPALMFHQRANQGRCCGRRHSRGAWFCVSLPKPVDARL
jgi:hypothetical protein